MSQKHPVIQKNYSIEGNTELFGKNHSTQTSVKLTSVVIHDGTKYAAGTVLPHGSTGAFPDFVEILQMFIVKDNLSVIVLSSFYRSFYVRPLWENDIASTV